MPAPADHDAQSDRNWKCYNRLGGQKSEFDDWAVVIAFYAALHTVHAFLARHQENPTSHPAREAALRRLGKTTAADALSQLLSAANDARYRCARFNSLRIAHLEQLAKVDLPSQLK